MITISVDYRGARSIDLKFEEFDEVFFDLLDQIEKDYKSIDWIKMSVNGTKMVDTSSSRVAARKARLIAKRSK